MPTVINIANDGEGKLQYTMTADAPWLGAESPQGILEKGKSAPVALSVKTAGLQSGEHKAEILVSAPGAANNPQTIPVTLILEARSQIEITPGSLSPQVTRGAEAPAETFEITNSGGVPVDYTLKTNEDWLKVEPVQGTLPVGQKAAFQVIYKTKDLGTGDYSTDVEVRDVQGRLVRKIPVKLNVKAKAAKQPAASDAGPCDYVISDDLWTKDQEATDKTQFGPGKIPGVLQGLILNYAEKGERDSERTSIGNSFSADEVELDYSREKSMVVNDPTYGPQKQRLWDIDVRINLFSPRGEWGGFQQRMYATRKEWVKDNYQYGAKDASPVKGADESFVTKKTLEGGPGKTSEEWHFAALKDGAVVYFNGSTSPDTLKLMGQPMDFYPMVERILSEISSGGWRAIFKKGNPKFDRLPAPLKPLVINAGTLLAERIYFMTDKMPGGGKQAGLRWMSLSYFSEPLVPFREDSSDEPAWEHSVHAQFYYPFKGGEKFVQGILDSRFKNPIPNFTYAKVSLGDGGFKQVGKDPRYTSYELRVGAAFLELGFKSRNKKFLDPPQERIDEIIQKIRNVDYDELFAATGESAEGPYEQEVLDESVFEEAPPVVLDGDFWDPATGTKESLPLISLPGEIPQAHVGPKSGDKNEQGQVWSPVAGGGWVKPEIYENDVSMIGQGKVYTDQWGWVDEKEAKEKQANYQKFQAANQVSDQKRREELQKMSQDIRDTKQKIKDAEAKHEKVEALRDKLDKLEEQQKQDALDARWNSKATMTNTAQLAAREIVTGSDAEGGTSYKAMALRMLMGSVTVGYSEVAYNTADASYQVYDHLKSGDSIMGAVAKTTMSMATSEVIGRAQAGVFSWGAKKATTAVRTAFGQAAEVGTEGLSKSLAKKKTSVEKVLAIKDDAARAEAIKKLYRGGGMEELSQLERKGHLGANDVKKMNQVISQEVNAAVDTGVKKTMTEFEKNTGVKIKEVMVGDSGSSASRKVRSVNTDADFASLPKFDEASLKTYADKNFGGDIVKANEKLSKKFSKAQDAFVDESLRTKGLSSYDVGYQTYDRFGATAGPGDAYTAGFVRTRQATQGKTTVFTPGEGGEIKSYKTSGQAMTDQDLLIRKDLVEKELQRLNTKTEGLSPRESAYMDARKKDLEKELKKISGEDSPKIEKGEAKDIMKQQEKALGKGSVTAEKASKALERADKALALEEASKNLEVLKSGGKASDIGKNSRIDPALVEKARLIRQNPQQVKQILGSQSEEEFVKQIDAAVNQAGQKI